MVKDGAILLVVGQFAPTSVRILLKLVFKYSTNEIAHAVGQMPVLLIALPCFFVGDAFL